MEKCIIVAIADNYAIGRKNALLWHLPGDLKYFKQQTLGCPVIMGWMTYQSIGRPLPRRKNIVISLFPWPEAPAEVTVVDSLAAAFAEAAKPCPECGAAPEKCFVMGGAYTYAEAMQDADTLYITHVHDVVEDADAFFPEIDPRIWEETSRSAPQEEDGVSYEFTVYRRRPQAEA